MPRRALQNETLTNIFWGLFLVWFGIVWASLKGDFISTINSSVFGLGVGFLLIMLNFLRVVFGIRVSPFTLIVGSIVFLIDFFSLFLRLSLPFLPMIFILAGILILVSSIRAAKYTSPG